MHSAVRQIAISTALVALVAPAACHKATPTGTDAASGAPSQSESVSTGEGTAHWGGSWSSASCGERKYERQISLTGDGKASGHELVSPCPPGSQCMWSGVVDWEGTWQGDASKITITPTTFRPRGGATAPGDLSWDDDAAAPAELAKGADGKRCVYRRAK